VYKRAGNEPEGRQIERDRTKHRVDVGRNEIDACRGEAAPKGIVIGGPQRLERRSAKGLRLVRDDDDARSRRREFRDAGDEIVRGGDDIRGPRRARQISRRVRDVVAAGADQIERGGVGDAVVGREIVVDLGDGRHCSLQAVGDAEVGLGVAGIAGRVIGAAGLVGRNSRLTKSTGKEFGLTSPGLVVALPPPCVTAMAKSAL